MLQWHDFESTDYDIVYAQQKRLVQQRMDGVILDTVLMGEHGPVLTLGRGTDAANIFPSTIPQVPIERGGDVTYHGPGQLVVYPIIKLQGQMKGLHRYLRLLEHIIVSTLAEFDIEAYTRHNPDDGEDTLSYTGVWVDDAEGVPKKIASIGVAVKRWVTYHGFALNVNTNLSAYQVINPCGFSAEVMTSMAVLLGGPVNMIDVKQAVKKATHHHLLHVQ